jgi:hypothetical protein
VQASLEEQAGNPGQAAQRHGEAVHRSGLKSFERRSTDDVDCQLQLAQSPLSRLTGRCCGPEHTYLLGNCDKIICSGTGKPAEEGGQATQSRRSSGTASQSAGLD